MVTVRVPVGRMLGAAVAAEDKLGYNEAPGRLLPERERVGVALLTAGNAADAEAVCRAELVKHVGNPRAPFGVRKSLEAQRSSVDAEERGFESAWSEADITLGDDLYPRRGATAAAPGVRAIATANASTTASGTVASTQYAHVAESSSHACSGCARS